MEEGGGVVVGGVGEGEGVVDDLEEDVGWEGGEGWVAGCAEDGEGGDAGVWVGVCWGEVGRWRGYHDCFVVDDHGWLSER